MSASAITPAPAPAPASSSGASRAAALTSIAPGFIANYFASSRLHHLSTWKADLSEFVLQHMRCAPHQYHLSPTNDPYRVIMHVDMDCFFASVGIRNRPHLQGKPVVVAHATSGVTGSDHYSSSEIASCNYEARAKGLKNGMFLGNIRSEIPDLVILPYEYDEYNKCSKELYSALLNTADYIQAVSCDEAYIDVTYVLKKRMVGALGNASGREYILQLERHARALAEEIRLSIRTSTGCSASIGISHNLLLARIATTRAKPNGAFFLTHHDGLQLLGGLCVRDLPGIGHSIAQKCSALGIRTCADVRTRPMSTLQAELGERIGETLHGFAFGEDCRTLENKPRQTLGADINWGIRFTSDEQVSRFLKEFSEEVYRRLVKAGLSASHVTVNAKKKLYEGEPHKFLGCGHCEDYSKSLQLSQSISSGERLASIVAGLYKQIGLKSTDVRGIGIHLKKLQPLPTGLFSSLAAPSRRTSSHSGASGDNAGSGRGGDEDSSRSVGHASSRSRGTAQTSMLAFTLPATAITATATSTTTGPPTNKPEAVTDDTESMEDLPGSQDSWPSISDIAELSRSSLLEEPSRSTYHTGAPLASTVETPAPPERKSEVAENKRGLFHIATAPLVKVARPSSLPRSPTPTCQPDGTIQSPCSPTASPSPELAVDSTIVSLASVASSAEFSNEAAKSAPTLSTPLAPPLARHLATSKPGKKADGRRDDKPEKRRITSYFHTSASHRNAVQTAVDLEIPEGVDRTVWEALPPELRSEQLALLRESKRSKVT